MAGKALQISNPFPSTLKPPPLTIVARKSPMWLPPRAAADDDTPAEPDASAEAPAPAPADPSFEKRLAQIRVKYRSGTGKKAEKRRARKSSPAAAAGAKKSVLLPPVPLREPMAAGGVAVEAGFTPYSERLNGRLAGLGLAALLLVELGSGKGLLRYHAPAVIFIQLYSVAAAGALFIKFEKERISVWPEKSPPSSAVTGD